MGRWSSLLGYDSSVYGRHSIIELLLGVKESYYNWDCPCRRPAHPGVALHPAATSGARPADDHSTCSLANGKCRCNADLVAQSSTPYCALVARPCKKAASRGQSSSSGPLNRNTNHATDTIVHPPFDGPLGLAKTLILILLQCCATPNFQTPTATEHQKFQSQKRQHPGHLWQVYSGADFTYYTKPSRHTPQSSPLPVASFQWAFLWVPLSHCP